MPKCDFNSNFIEITLRYGYSPVNILHIFRTPFPKGTSEWKFLKMHSKFDIYQLFKGTTRNRMKVQSFQPSTLHHYSHAQTADDVSKTIFSRSAISLSSDPEYLRSNTGTGENHEGE